MTKTLYIVRHGNTFDKGDVVTRVGGLTDLHLSKSGETQAAHLAEAFSSISLTACYSSPLLRTRQTAEAICGGHGIGIQNAEFLREIDYGPDENKAETEVIGRLGEKAIQDWERHTIVPEGWCVNPEAYRKAWKDFITALESETTVVVTSNGVARFLLDALSINVPSRKMKTGSVSRFDFKSENWALAFWGKRPPL